MSQNVTLSQVKFNNRSRKAAFAGETVGRDRLFGLWRDGRLCRHFARVPIKAPG